MKRLERLAATRPFLEDEVRRIAVSEARTVAETRRLLLLEGVRAYGAGATLRAERAPGRVEGKLAGQLLVFRHPKA